MSDEIKKKKFEVRTLLGSNPPKRAIFIDEEHFDWEVDQNSMAAAKKMGGYFWMAAQLDIQKHFLESLSEFLGREVTPPDIQKAIKDGWI